MFAVGEAVRVLSSDKSVSYRAIVSLCGADDTYDVILAHSAAGQNDEEVGVQRSRISPIEAFEKIADTDSTEAETLKSYGNTLFTLKDYSATMEYYKKAITVATQSQPAGDAFTVGQSVLVSFRDSIDYQSGIVSDVDVSLSTADVMFDDSAMDEEVAVPFTRLLPLAVSSKDRLLQRSVYMNMARSVLKREQKGWAIKYCSLAIAIAKHFQSTTESLDTSGVTEVEVNKMLADGYYFRAKALLMACRPKFANQDCKNLQLYDNTKAAALQKEIQSFKEKTAKSNRKLARDIASWVESAMSIDTSQAKGQGKGTSGSAEASNDLGILDEGEDGEEHNIPKFKLQSRQQAGNVTGDAKQTKGSNKKDAEAAEQRRMVLLSLGILLGAVLMYVYLR